MCKVRKISKIAERTSFQIQSASFQLHLCTSVHVIIESICFGCQYFPLKFSNLYLYKKDSTKILI